MSALRFPEKQKGVGENGKPGMSQAAGLERTASR